MSNLKLHEAIVLLLKEKGTSLSASQIADDINRRGLYHKKDRSPVKPGQIRLRVRNYPHLFTYEGNIISLRNEESSFEINPTINKDSSDKRPMPWLVYVEDTISQGSKDTFAFSLIMSKIAISDVSKVSFLREVGFYNIGEIVVLLQRGLPSQHDLMNCGVYAITAPRDYKVSYCSSEQVLKSGNVVNPWALEKLRSKWVAGVDVLYYGLAGRDTYNPLHARLTSLLLHASGRTTDRGPHKGGEIIWQLNGSEDFEVWALPTDPPPVPRQLEAALIKRFYAIKGALPFANRQF